MKPLTHSVYTFPDLIHGARILTPFEDLLVISFSLKNNTHRLDHWTIGPLDIGPLFAGGKLSGGEADEPFSDSKDRGSAAKCHGTKECGGRLSSRSLFGWGIRRNMANCSGFESSYRRIEGARRSKNAGVSPERNHHDADVGKGLSSSGTPRNQRT